MRAGLIVTLVLVLAGSFRAQDPAGLERLGASAARAYETQRFGAAELLYRDYFKQAAVQSEAKLMDAGIGLVASLFAQYKFAEARQLLEGLPADYAKLHKLNPRLPAALHPENLMWMNYWRARLLLADGQPAAARAEFDKARQAPDAARARSAEAMIGYCLLAEGKVGDAEAYFRRLMEQGATTESRNDGSLGYGQVLLRQQQLAKVEPLINSWWEAAHRTPGAWHDGVGILKVLLLMAKNQPAEAMDFYAREFRGNFKHLTDQTHFVVIRSLGEKLAQAGGLDPGGGFDRARRLYGSILPELTVDHQRQEVILAMGDHAFAAARAAIALNLEAESTKWLALGDDDLSRFLSSYRQSEMTPRVCRQRGQLRRVRGKLLEDKALLQKAQLQYDAAVADLETAVNHPQAPALTRYEAMMELADHLWVQGRKVEPKKLDVPADWFAKAAKLEVPKEFQAKALMLRGEVLLDAGLFDDAAHEFKIVANQYTDSSQALRARYRQGDATFKAGTYKNAAVVFSQFLDDARPDDALRPQAMYWKGVSHRLAQEADESIRILRKLEEEYPNAPDSLAPRALLQAAEAAIAAEIGNDAIGLLSQVIEKYAKSPEVPQALYRRIFCHLHFGNDVEAARQDWAVFSDPNKGDFSKTNPEFAADILLWLGDYFAGRREYRTAEGYMLQVVREFADSRVAPDALYEAAKCAYYLDRKDDALVHLNRLQEKFGQRMTDRTAAQADYLRGDILASRLQYKDADASFQQCAKRVKGRLHFAAIGRSGDMRFSMAGKAEKQESEKLYLEALSSYNEIINDKDSPADFKRKALYRRASVRRELREDPLAISDLSMIFDSYEVSVIRQQHWDWFYFVRAGLELAAYYENNDRIAEAIKVYQRMGSANISYAEEARKRAAELMNR